MPEISYFWGIQNTVTLDRIFFKEEKMPRLIKKISKKIGAPPGTVVFIGDQKTEQVTIEIIDYDGDKFEQKFVAAVEDCFPFKESSTVSWININGIHDVEQIQRLGEHFEIHPLILEDISNTGHRPKIEDGGNFIFVILKMLSHDEKNKIVSEQASLLMGKNLVITFQEKAGDVFDPVRERIKRLPRKRFLNADYLAYALMDIVVDNYFVILEQFGDTLEVLEDEFVNDPSPENLETIHDLKYQLIFMRKTFWPLREVIGGLERTESKLMKKEIRPYLRDLYEHTIQVIDTSEIYREMVSGLLDIYLSSVSNKMNQVMKVLTIMATIFIPLGFLAGVYGMNFNTDTSPFNMPELSFRYGYILFWLVALVIGFGLFFFFKRKKWL
jgi:magnesium transporter